MTIDTIMPLLPPPPSTFEPYEPVDLPPPLYSLSFSDTNSSKDSDETSQVNGSANVDSHERLEEGWLWATVQENKRVTHSDWWQDVRELDLVLEDTSKT